MNNSPLNLNSIRQPTPSVQNPNGTNERVFNRPNIGVVNPPSISSTPIDDTLEIKRQENPKMAYKITPKSRKGFKIQNLFSLGIFGCSIGALFELLKKTT